MSYWAKLDEFTYRKSRVDRAPTTELLQRLIEIMKQSQGRRLSKPRASKVKPAATAGRQLGKLATS